MTGEARRQLIARARSRERLDRTARSIRERKPDRSSNGTVAAERRGRSDRADAGRRRQRRRQRRSGSGAREEYTRELQRSRESLGRMQAEQRDGGGATPEQHECSRSAPGNEAFKQDFSRWESLRKDVDLALERYEAAAVGPPGHESRRRSLERRRQRARSRRLSAARVAATSRRSRKPAVQGSPPEKK